MTTMMKKEEIVGIKINPSDNIGIYKMMMTVGDNINNMEKVMKVFNENMEIIRSYDIIKLKEIEYKIMEKNREYEELEIRMNKYIELKTEEMKNKNKEMEIEKCMEVARKNNYMMIINQEYEKKNRELEILKEKNEELEIKFEEKLEEKIEMEKERIQTMNKQYEEKINNEKEKLVNLQQQEIITKELKHKAEIAELIAQNRQQTREIEFLNQSIVNLKNEISEQRTLTKEVAQAQANAQAQMTHNNYEKKKN